MKYLFILVCVFLNACSEGSTRNIEIKKLPEELKDCSFYRLDPGGTANVMTVVRCPLSVTTTKISKYPNVVVIDGQEYIKK